MADPVSGAACALHIYGRRLPRPRPRPRLPGTIGCRCRRPEPEQEPSRLSRMSRRGWRRASEQSRPGHLCLGRLRAPSVVNPQPLVRRYADGAFGRGRAQLSDLGDGLLAVSLAIETEGRMDLDPVLVEPLAIDEDRNYRGPRTHGQDAQ